MREMLRTLHLHPPTLKMGQILNPWTSTHLDLRKTKLSDWTPIL
jgi:hypothetical protein